MYEKRNSPSSLSYLTVSSDSQSQGALCLTNAHGRWEGEPAGWLSSGQEVGCPLHPACLPPDVYSYDEDDMVLDPSLAEHLSHFGIDMLKMQKVREGHRPQERQTLLPASGVLCA